MTQVREVSEFLDQFAPTRLAEEWDNVGLLVGDAEQPVRGIMTCLTVTPATAGEAVAESADLVVTHHPMPFRPLKRLTSDSNVGRLLLDLIRAGVAVHSPHTAFDSAPNGINQQLAEGLGLTGIAPLEPLANDPDGLGAGRHGRLAETTPLDSLAEQLKQFLQVDRLKMVGAADQPIDRVAVACGSAGQFLAAACRNACQALVTGETSFHTCLEAEASGVALLLPGHFASERFAVERLAEVLDARFSDCTVWASRNERDPIRWL